MTKSGQQRIKTLSLPFKTKVIHCVILEVFIANSVNPDQTATYGIVKYVSKHASLKKSAVQAKSYAVSWLLYTG